MPCSLKFMIGAAMIASSISAYAQSSDKEIVFTYNDLKYNVVSEEERTCEVGYNPNADGRITIPATVDFGGEAFNVVGIAEYAFEFANTLKSLVIEDGIQYIGNYAFNDCSAMMEIFLPGTLTNIGSYCFWNCVSLTSIDIPESVESLQMGTFFNCKALESIFISPNIKEIPLFAFASCKALTDIEIPEGVETLAMNAFIDCYNLKNVVLPSTLKTVVGNCFNNCSVIKSISCAAVLPPSLFTSAFDDVVYKSATLEVPEESVETYKAANGWKNFVNIKSSGVESINEDQINAIFQLNGSTLDALQAMEIYNLEGGRIATLTSGQNIMLPSGAYIVRDIKGARSIKIMI